MNVRVQRRCHRSGKDAGVPVPGDATEAGEDGEKQVVGSSLMLLEIRLAFAGKDAGAPARGDSTFNNLRLHRG